MSNIHLYSVMVGDKPMVKYLMKQKGGNVLGQTSPGSAMWMLTNDRKKVPHMTEEFPGFPLTADGVYFFDGDVEDGEATSSVSGKPLTPSPEGEGAGVAAEIGADGLPIPAGDGKKRSGKRVRK